MSRAAGLLLQERDLKERAIVPGCSFNPIQSYTSGMPLSNKKEQDVHMSHGWTSKTY